MGDTGGSWEMLGALEAAGRAGELGEVAGGNWEQLGGARGLGDRIGGHWEQLGGWEKWERDWGQLEGLGEGVGGHWGGLGGLGDTGGYWEHLGRARGFWGESAGIYWFVLVYTGLYRFILVLLSPTGADSPPQGLDPKNHHRIPAPLGARRQEGYEWGQRGGHWGGAVMVTPSDALGTQPRGWRCPPPTAPATWRRPGTAGGSGRVSSPPQPR